MTDIASRSIYSRRLRRSAVAGSLAVLTALAGACTSSGSSSAGSGGGSGGNTGSASSGVNTLVMANAVKVDTLDPEQNSVNESIWIDQNLYSRLVAPNATAPRSCPTSPPAGTSRRTS